MKKIKKIPRKWYFFEFKKKKYFFLFDNFYLFFHKITTYQNSTN